MDLIRLNYKSQIVVIYLCTFFIYYILVLYAHLSHICPFVQFLFQTNIFSLTFELNTTSLSLVQWTQHFSNSLQPTNNTHLFGHTRKHPWKITKIKIKGNTPINFNYWDLIQFKPQWKPKSNPKFGPKISQINMISSYKSNGYDKTIKKSFHGKNAHLNNSKINNNLLKPKPITILT
jgi:hypothetical protein